MSRRHKRHEEHDEHHSEAWLVAFADMMTLLFVTFLMMFAISSFDLKKFQSFKEAFVEGTGQSTQLLASSGSPADGNPNRDRPGDPTEQPNAEPSPQPIADKNGNPVIDRKELEDLKAKIDASLVKAGIKDKVESKIDPRGLVLTVTSGVLFASGEAEVQPAGAAVLARLAPVLGTVGNDLSVEGHTDNRPISSPRFPSNWELSTARATSVLQWLRGHATLDDGRLSASGFGDARPVAGNSSDGARAKNRRVEVIVHAPQPVLSAPAPAVQPAAATGTAKEESEGVVGSD